MPGGNAGQFLGRALGGTPFDGPRGGPLGPAEHALGLRLSIVATITRARLVLVTFAPEIVLRLPRLCGYKGWAIPCTGERSET